MGIVYPFTGTGLIQVDPSGNVIITDPKTRTVIASYSVGVGPWSFSGGIVPTIWRKQVVNFANPLTIDLSLGNFVQVPSLTGDLNLNNPINVPDGITWALEVTQDATGGRLINWHPAAVSAWQPPQQASGLGTIYFGRGLGIAADVPIAAFPASLASRVLAIASLTNPTAETDMQTLRLGAGQLNGGVNGGVVPGSGLRIRAEGDITVGATGNTIPTFRVYIGALKLATFTPAAVTANSVQAHYRIECLAWVNPPGATANLHVHGELRLQGVVGALSAQVMTVYPDTNLSAVGTVDLTAVQVVKTTVQTDVSDASTVVHARNFSVEVLNPY